MWLNHDKNINIKKNPLNIVYFNAKDLFRIHQCLWITQMCYIDKELNQLNLEGVYVY